MKTDLNDERIAALEITPFWAGDLLISQVDLALKDQGVPEVVLPRAPSRATCMRRAFDECAPRGAKIDPLPKGMGVAMSLKDASMLDLDALAQASGGVVRRAASYNATLTAKIFVENKNGTEIETLQFSPEDHPMVPWIKEVYKAKKEYYKASEDLSQWFSQTIIPCVGGIGKRSRGGVYYVPAIKRDLILKVAAALESVSNSSTIHRSVAGVNIPVCRLTHGGKLCIEPRYGTDSACMEIMVDGIIREADNTLDDLSDLLDANASGDKKLGKRALASKKEVCAKLEGEIATWEKVASLSLDLLRNRLEEVRSAIGISEMALEFDDLKK